MGKYKYMVHIAEATLKLGDTYYFGDSLKAVKAEAINDGYEESEITGAYELELIEGTESLPG